MIDQQLPERDAPARNTLSYGESTNSSVNSAAVAPESAAEEFTRGSLPGSTTVVHICPMADRMLAVNSLTN